MVKETKPKKTQVAPASAKVPPAPQKVKKTKPIKRAKKDSPEWTDLYEYSFDKAKSVDGNPSFFLSGVRQNMTKREKFSDAISRYLVAKEGEEWTGWATLTDFRMFRLITQKKIKKEKKGVADLSIPALVPVPLHLTGEMKDI